MIDFTFSAIGGYEHATRFNISINVLVVVGSIWDFIVSYKIDFVLS